jgi:hypothetical protein
MSKSGRLNYTTINHDARVILGLTINEYCVFDLIHNLSTNPKNIQMGWCYAKKETLAGYLDLGRATVFRAISKGLDLGLLEKHPEQPALIRATSKWYDEVLIKSESQNDTASIDMRYEPSQTETQARLKMRTNKDIDNKNDNSTAVRKKGQNGVASIGEILRQSGLSGSKSSGITHEWQAHAIRLWSELGLAGTPSRQFFSKVKRAYQDNTQAKLSAALSYCKDAVGVRNKERLFYWRYAEEL